jgi:DNA polymerase III sliding clamp (beta) subunit (PCNA family)
MKALLPAKELKHALTGLGKVLDRKASLPVLQGIRIEATRDSLRLTATNLDSFVSYVCLSSQIREPGSVILTDIPRLKELVAQATKD